MPAQLEHFVAIAWQLALVVAGACAAVYFVRREFASVWRTTAEAERERRQQLESQLEYEREEQREIRHDLQNRVGVAEGRTDLTIVMKQLAQQIKEARQDRRRDQKFQTELVSSLQSLAENSVTTVSEAVHKSEQRLIEQLKKQSNVLDSIAARLNGENGP